MPRLAALCLAVCLSPAAAQEPNLAPVTEGAAGAATRLVLAQHAYAEAMTSGDPVMLLAAIRLARGVTTRPATAWERVVGADPPADQPAGRAGPPDPGGPAALTILQGLAGDDPNLQDLVYDLDAQLPHARLQVATLATATVGGGGQDDWRLPLSGAVPAEIALIGDADGPLGLTVRDEGGAVVCAHPPSTDPALCRLTPARNGFFTVEVANPGAVANSYQLVGN
jgi:hypothetical protein